MHDPIPSPAQRPTPRLIAIDMDGTLMNSAGAVSVRNRLALHHAEHAGVEIVIATGRRYGYAMGVLRALGLRATSALVASNGTVIRTVGGQLLRRTEMPLRTARWLAEHLEAFRDALVFTFDNIDAGGHEPPGSLVMEHTHNLHGSIGRWMQANAPFIHCVEDIGDALRGDPPIQAMLSGPVARMRAAEGRLREHPGVVPVGADSHDVPAAELVLHRTEYPERDLSIVDILPAGCSKASALAYLAELRGLGSEDVLALGDNWNDLPMFEFAGRSVVMANAPADLRELARSRGWAVGASNDEDGVARAIEDALSLASRPGAADPEPLGASTTVAEALPPLASSVRW